MLNELFISIEIEIIFVTNNRAVSSVGLGSCLSFPFWGSAKVFNYNYN